VCGEITQAGWHSSDAMKMELPSTATPRNHRFQYTHHRSPRSSSACLRPLNPSPSFLGLIAAVCGPDVLEHQMTQQLQMLAAAPQGGDHQGNKHRGLGECPEPERWEFRKREWRGTSFLPTTLRRVIQLFFISKRGLINNGVYLLQIESTST